MSERLSMDALRGARTESLAGQDGSVEARFAFLQATLLGDFAAWLETEVPGHAIPEAAGRVLARFSEEVLDGMLQAADRWSDPETGRRLRLEFAQAVGCFGQALRERVPDAQRHAAAQILQIRTLEAERIVSEALAARASTAGD